MSEENKNQKGEANFNDSELQDIMAEIESLEQDFSNEEIEDELVDESQDSEITDESEFEDSDFEEDSSPQADIDEECTVSEITPSHKNSSECPMEFYGSGVLDFNMSFPVGAQKANVSVEDGKVKVVLGEVSFSISEDGCFVEMAGGVQFSVPAPAQKSIKKAA